MTPRYTLAFSCPDRPGIVFRTSGTLIGDIPFHHLPVTRETRPAQEAEVRRIVSGSGADHPSGC